MLFENRVRYFLWGEEQRNNLFFFYYFIFFSLHSSFFSSFSFFFIFFFLFFSFYFFFPDCLVLIWLIFCRSRNGFQVPRLRKPQTCNTTQSCFRNTQGGHFGKERRRWKYESCSNTESGYSSSTQTGKCFWVFWSGCN